MTHPVAWALLVAASLAGCVRGGFAVAGDSWADATSADAAADGRADLAPDSAADGAPADAGAESVPIDPTAPFGAPRRIEELSSEADEDDPTLTGDLLLICFERDSDIWCAERASTTADWDAAEKVDVLSSDQWDSNPELAPDGLTIFFSSHVGPHVFDLHVSTRPSRASEWAAPVPITELNVKENQSCPTPAPDLLSLYFTSRDGGESFELVVAERSGVGQLWGAPQPLPGLALPLSETISPFPADGGRVIYFADGDGVDFDLYVATRPMAGGTFGAPVALDSLNLGDYNDDPWLTPDQRTIYFTSDVAGTKDLYVATR